MTEEEFDGLNGRVLAISMTLNAIIGTLPQLSAAQAAVALKMEQMETERDDAANETPAAEARSRDLILGLYVDLLSAAAQRDG